MNILTVNLLFSTFVFWVIAKIYLFPKLLELGPRAVLLPILLLHSFRHLGLMFLAPGATYAGIPPQFAYPAAFGDLLAAFLALAAIPAVHRNIRAARLRPDRIRCHAYGGDYIRSMGWSRAKHKCAPSATVMNVAELLLCKPWTPE